MRVTTILTTICAIAAVFTFSAVADDGHDRGGRNNNENNGSHSRFESTLVGSIPATTVGGVPSGGVPWVINQSEASLNGGQLHVEFTGLLIANAPGVPANLVGTVGPVKMVGASVVCGGSGGSVAASSDGTPLNSSGDAEIDTAVTLPSTCMAPVILVRIFNASAPIGSQLGPFIALTGLTSGSGNNNNNNNHDQ